jgi:hypothetical protein
MLRYQEMTRLQNCQVVSDIPLKFKAKTKNTRNSQNICLVLAAIQWVYLLNHF